MLAEGTLLRQGWTALLTGEGHDTSKALRICVVVLDHTYCHRYAASRLLTHTRETRPIQEMGREHATGSGTYICTIVGSVVSSWPTGPYPFARAGRWRARHRRLYYCLCFAIRSGRHRR